MLTDAEKQALEDAKARKSSRGQGFGDSQPRQPGKAPSGHRVEAVNALALANQQMIGELQDVVALAANTQKQAADQTAQAFESLLSGEYFYGHLQQRLAKIRPPAPLDVQFQTVTAAGLLPDSESVLRDLNLLPGNAV